MPNWAKYEWLYKANHWVMINGRWADVHGNGFSQESLDEANRLFGE